MQIPKQKKMEMLRSSLLSRKFEEDLGRRRSVRVCARRFGPRM